ncbi:MAG: hypothetical protein CFE43_10125 [Burkholderiales bacterium PBB3]|nr:MAG: hypothetical protein CFE43_10125 [Burkholderiales bacterium PBB3]
MPIASKPEEQSRWTALLLGLMMILTPALGVPSEDLLQDTLKSAIVALMVLGTGMLFFWHQRYRQSPVVWHGLMWLPLGLAAYALGSMAWSHAYLAAVEAARWLVLSLLLWLGMNMRVEDLEDRLLWGIHWGATIASVWAAWQFWGNLSLFPQGANPASSFVNRNFFAEFVICALPYSLFLLLRARDFRVTLSLAAGIGFNLAALMMTGTRSALMALLVLCLVLPLIVIRCWPQLAVSNWGLRKNLVVAAIIAGSCLLFGSIPTGNPSLAAEFGAQSAIDRASSRTASVAAATEYTTGSFSIRSVMWAATARMALANPLAGVGAGAWEVEIPRYQTAATVTETDYYAHNEFLQLLAEYGIVGAAFLGGLFAYLLVSAYKTWLDRTSAGTAHAPLRAFALTSLLMLLIVSNAGFPWHMACTSAMFALSLSLLAATDSEMGSTCRLQVSRHRLHGIGLKSALGACTLATAFALFASQQAAVAERSLVQSAQLAMLIGGSPDPRSPDWRRTKSQMLDLVRQGIAINPHYRKITPMVADQLALWGDLKNALWIWESVDASRPNVIAIICNIARAYMELGDLAAARKYFERAQSLQTHASIVRALDIELLSREGKIALAKQRLETLFDSSTMDGDFALLAYKIGTKIKDGALIVQALEWRVKHQSGGSVETWLKLGAAYDKQPDVRDPDKALAAYRAAMNATPEKYLEITRRRIPEAYRTLLPAR